MRLGVKFSVTTAVIVIVLSVLLEATGLVVFRKELYHLSKNLFIEKVDRLILLAYEQDEMFFEGLYSDDVVGRKRVIDKIRIIFRNEKDKTTFPFVVNNDGRIVIHPEYEEARPMFTGTALALIQARKDGDFEYYDGTVRKWCVFKKYAPWGWTFCMTTSVTKRDAAMVSFIWGAVGISLVVVIAAVLVILWFARKFVRPLGQVIRRLEKIADGEIPLTHIAEDGPSGDEIGTLTRSFNVMTDRLRETMDGLRKSEEKYKSLFENAVEGIFRTTMDGRVVAASPSLARILGYDSPAELMEKIVNLREQFYVLPERRDEFLRLIRVEKRVSGFQFQCYRKDRSIIWASIHVHIVTDTMGQGVLMEGMLEDISERKAAEEELIATMVSRDALMREVETRKRAEEELRESEKAYRSLFETSRDAIMMLDSHGFLDCNKATLEMFRCDSRDQFVSKHPSEVSPEFQPNGQKSLLAADAYIQAAFKEGWQFFEWTHRKIDGTLFFAEVLLNRVEFRRRTVLQSVVRDITERKRSQELLCAAKERAEQLMFLVPSAVFTVDNERHITSWNRMMEEITGYAKEEVIGKQCELMGINTCFERCSLFSQDIPKPIIGKECQIRNKSGAIRTISKNVDMLCDTDGQVIGGIESFEDITERKQAEDALKKAYAELRSMQEQLLQSQKMASVGQLAAGVAHEINNPAGFVTSNLEVLERYICIFKQYLEQYSKAESCVRQVATAEALCIIGEIERLRNEYNLDVILADLPGLMQQSLDGMHRIRRIVADLRSFSHSDTGTGAEVDVHELIQSALNIAGNEIKYKAEIVTEYAKVPLIWCYPQQLSQVFLNILLNASQAISEKGKITIKTFVEDDVVVIEIMDTGCGMSEDVRQRVFEPFFTTKPVGTGTGLGLSLAYNIIEKHKGEILVGSRPGEGTKFTIRLPIKRSELGV